MSEPTWRSDMADSRSGFEAIVWPEIRHWFGDDPDLYPTEGRPDALAEAFDRVAGVDFWAVESEMGMLSIASRVQTYDYETYTIRYKRASGAETEYQKRLRQLNNDYELPTFTIQAYIDRTLGVLRNAAAVKTRALYRYIKNTGKPGDEWPLIGSDESEQFFPVSWRELDAATDLRIHNRQRAETLQRPNDPNDITEWGAE